MSVCRLSHARRLVALRRGIVFVPVRLQSSLEQALSTLNLQAKCSQQEARDAFVKGAKVFHPDSGSSEANQEKFTLLSEAYQVVIADISKRENLDMAEDVTVEDILKGTLPVAHRKYLTNDGIGFGTPSQRQRQYQAYRLNRASSAVSDYKIRKLQLETEDSQLVVVKDFARRSKTTHFIDRLVEDLIQESMAKGEFKDLKGGKVETPNIPYVNQHDFHLNKVLINNGFSPDWIQARQQLESDIKKARDNIFLERKRLYGSLKTRHIMERWKEHCAIFEDNIANINKDIQSYNLITPIIKTQKIMLDFENEMEKIEKRLEDYLNSDEFQEKMQNSQHQETENSQSNLTTMMKSWFPFLNS